MRNNGFECALVLGGQQELYSAREKTSEQKCSGVFGVWTRAKIYFATVQEKNLTYVYSLCYNPNS
uniref:Uncharacterized protein n=1 Tax=Eubacterium cellulosolvens (strain ATCC 43171 / JCM 9499 / 6) TaxID=633697 RepID=I5AVJ7_EUBC6